jgi:hypothetical protein
MRKLIANILLLFAGLVVYSQTTQTEFGKNRVQYHHHFDEWSQYESQNFITYWYGEGRLVGQSVVQIAEYDFREIQGILEHRINDKMEIIVYTDITDLKQSNIGSEEAFENTGGQTKIVGNKMFVYFNGDHRDLRRQIREGIATVYMNAMLFGSNLQEIVQNAVMLNLPEWFKVGLISFVGDEWNTTYDDQLRDLFLSGKYKNFEAMAREHPRITGHSFWNYISRLYGYSTVSNLLYLTRINRSIESGFLYVIGSTYQKTAEAWNAYYRNLYETEAKELSAADSESAGTQTIKIRNKRNLPLSQLKVSPDGTKIAYVTNEIGRIRVWMQDVQSGDRQLVFKSGFRNAIQATDYNYPLVAWSPTNMEFAVIYEKRDIVYLMRFDIATKQRVVEEMSPQFQRIYSMDYISPNDFVISAAVRGQSDLFLYFTLTRQAQRLTTDFWDDLDATFVRVHGQRGILFSSNRADSLNVQAVLDSILPIQNFDIYYMSLESPSELVRVTNTPHANERKPAAVDTTWFAFLTDESGIYNRKAGYLENYIHHFENVITFQDGTKMRLHADSILTEKLDSVALSLIDTVWLDTIVKQRAINRFVSKSDRNILEHHKAFRSDLFAELVVRDGKYRVSTGRIDTSNPVTPGFTNFQKLNVRIIEPSPVMMTESQRRIQKPTDKPEPEKAKEQPAKPQDSTKIDIDNYLFQSKFDDKELPKKQVETQPGEPEEPSPEVSYTVIDEDTDIPERKVHQFRSSRIIPYRLKFRTDYVTTQMDNSLMFDGLNSYSGVPEDFGYPPPGILLKANFKDLFEDYEIEGGIRIPTSFNGSEYFLLFNDRKGRLDKRYAVYRRRLRFTPQPSPPPVKYDNTISLFQYQLRYPLDVFTSIRGTATLRFDNTHTLSTNQPTLETPTSSTQRLGIKGEYVFDNTLDVALNTKNGTRYKVFAELVKGFDISLSNDPSFKTRQGFMAVMGVDFRHYQRVLKYSVLASRIASTTSLGEEKILYMLGGTDNWMFPQFDMTIPLPPGENFVYRSMATNLRGFRLNARNGNSYALLNTEIRMPVLKYIFQRSRSSFINNFQLIGFFDAGTAWQGLNPFDEKSPLNTWTSSNNNVTIKVNYFRDPVVLGYGAGIRTLLFGYFLRLDYGWGVETRKVQDPKLYFSVGLDF